MNWGEFSKQYKKHRNRNLQKFSSSLTEMKIWEFENVIFFCCKVIHITLCINVIRFITFSRWFEVILKMFSFFFVWFHIASLHNGLVFFLFFSCLFIYYLFFLSLLLFFIQRTFVIYFHRIWIIYAHYLFLPLRGIQISLSSEYLCKFLIF